MFAFFQVRSAVADVIESIDDLSAGVFGDDDEAERENLKANLPLVKDQDPKV